MAEVEYHVALPSHVRLSAGTLVDAVFRALKVDWDEIGFLSRTADGVVVAIAEKAAGFLLPQFTLHLTVNGVSWPVLARRANSLPLAQPRTAELCWVPQSLDPTPPSLPALRSAVSAALGITSDELGTVRYHNGILRVEIPALLATPTPLPKQIDVDGESWTRVEQDGEEMSSLLRMVQRFVSVFGSSGAQQLHRWMEQSEALAPVSPTEPGIQQVVPTGSAVALTAPRTMTEAILAADFVSDADLESPEGRAFFRKLPRDVARAWLTRNASQVHRPYQLWRHLRLRHEWSLVDPSLERPAPPEVQHALLSYLARAPLDERDRRTAEGLRRQGFRVDHETVSHPVLNLPAELVREACSGLSRDLISRLITTLTETLDPEARFVGVTAMLRRGLDDHDLTQQDGPASPLLHVLYDLGAGTDVWLLAGGRLIAGLGRLCYRYPAMESVVSETVLAHDDLWGPDRVQNRAFRAACLGDTQQAAEAVAEVDDSFAKAGLGCWPTGRLILADLAQRRGDEKAAQRYVSDAEEAGKNWPEVLLWRADMESAAGMDTHAVSTLQPLRSQPYGRARLGRLHFRLGQFQQARSLGYTAQITQIEPDTHDWSAQQAPLTVHDLEWLLSADGTMPHERKYQVWTTLGYGVLAASELERRFRTGSLDERGVLHLCEMATGPFGDVISVHKKQLAEQVLLATGAALPGAGGYEPAHSLWLAEKLLRQTGDIVRAETTAMIHRDVLDRTVEQGVRSPWLTVAWLRWLEGRIAVGQAEAWDQRRGVCLRLLRDTPLQEVSVLTAVAAMYRQLARIHPDNARVFADGLLTVLPENAGALQSGDQEVAEATIQLLRLILPDDQLGDERLKHAPDLRIEAAEDLVAQGQWEAALSAGVALCNRDLLPTYRYRAVVVLLKSLARLEDMVSSPMLRKGWVRAEEGPEDLAWPTWRAFLTTDDPRLLSVAWATIETLPKKRNIGIREYASLADVFGHMVATVAAGLPWAGYKIPVWTYWNAVPAAKYWIARSLTRGVLTLSRLRTSGADLQTPALEAEPDWTILLVEAARSQQVDEGSMVSVKQDWDGLQRGWPRWLVFFRGISGEPSLRRIDRKNPESYWTYGARIFAGETAKGGQDGYFIEKHQPPGVGSESAAALFRLAAALPETNSGENWTAAMVVASGHAVLAAGPTPPHHGA